MPEPMSRTQGLDSEFPTAGNAYRVSNGGNLGGDVRKLTLLAVEAIAGFSRIGMVV